MKFFRRGKSGVTIDKFEEVGAHHSTLRYENNWEQSENMQYEIPVFLISSYSHRPGNAKIVQVSIFIENQLVVILYYCLYPNTNSLQNCIRKFSNSSKTRPTFFSFLANFYNWHLNGFNISGDIVSYRYIHENNCTV